ncbi:DUF3010 family protein [Portibacter lacus]|uniref:DUF3010 family protein n=1 Tax=Portibacter lacus TaxID=1099794 RepID=A0AA37WC23_9BACT|nr:DUF3010 family protein [Portibacter lacus]GLR16046.1 hypothetical protein GCM10007940_06610 [Portibacter lacus]
MKVCGIDLKGNDAVLVCLEGNIDDHHLIIEEVRKIKLGDALDQKSVIEFSENIKSFLEENEFDAVGIKARATKGRFAGGSVSFKMEGIIQTSSAAVEVIHAATIKAALKSLDTSAISSQIKAYQSDAYLAAAYLLKPKK